MLTRQVSRVIPLLFTVVVLGCAKDGQQAYDAVSPEEVVQTSDYPMVAMVAMPNGDGMCTGTFVGSKVLLTAAHCAQAAGTYYVFSSFGTFTTNQVETLSQGELNDPNDLAVLVFDRPVASWDEGQIAYIGDPVQEDEKVTIVGYGCDNLSLETGTGTKRMGQNYVASISDYIELLTPKTDASVQRILGPLNRAGSCFGDSGGPMFRLRNSLSEIVGVTHSGGYLGNQILSRYIDLGQSQNVVFLQRMASKYDLDITQACPGGSCSQAASTSLTDLVKMVWNRFVGILSALGLKLF